MLAFPRYFDMFEMKRPQFINRYFEDEDESPFTNNQLPQQNKQPKRIQVPVQHEPTAQQYQRQFQQMPIPQPSGVSHSQQHRDTTAPVNNEMHRSAEMAREVPINVQQGTARPVQRQPRMQNHVTQPQHPSPEPTMSTPVQAGMPMPQPQPTAQAAQPSTSYTEQGDTYTQPKPPAPKPKEQWVDPRITAALESIQKIADEARTVGTQVDVIEVTSKDKKYLTLEEQLTKLLLKLDCIESFGDENVRSKRKACIKQVQQTLDALELKLIAS
ncbi:uncharacterized protein LOC120335364 isoform X2 [Styela clava]